VHEACGDLLFQHQRFSEAMAAFDNAAKSGECSQARLAYKRALAQLSQGNFAGAQKDISRALHANPGMSAAVRARDGLAALQAIMEGNYRHAHVRLNMLIHMLSPTASGAGPVSPEQLPVLFLPHEFLLYRGVCSLYLGETAAAIQDLETAAELARRLAASSADGLEQKENAADEPSSDRGPQAGTKGGAAATAENLRRRHLPPEPGLEIFECEVLYNVAVCHLTAREYHSALVTCEQLLQRSRALQALATRTECLVWFLIGVCHLANGECRDELAREAFMRSYAHDPVYVDDFLRRHGRRHEPVGKGNSLPPSASRALLPPRSRVGGPAAAMRPLGGCQLRPAWMHVPSTSREVCDAVPEAVCCLRHEPLMLSNSLPPCRLQVRDVVVWGKPSLAWPFIRPPDLVMPSSLARLDLLQHCDAAAPPLPLQSQET